MNASLQRCSMSRKLSLNSEICFAMCPEHRPSSKNTDSALIPLFPDSPNLLHRIVEDLSMDYSMRSMNSYAIPMPPMNHHNTWECIHAHLNRYFHHVQIGCARIYLINPPKFRIIRNQTLASSILVSGLFDTKYKFFC